MNEIVFSHKPQALGFAFAKYREVERGIARLHLVEDYDHLRRLFDTVGLASWIPNQEKYETYDEYVEEQMESTITFETLCFVLFHVDTPETVYALHKPIYRFTVLMSDDENSEFR